MKPEDDFPSKPVRQPGYYPGHSTLGQKQHWDQATRDKVLKRVNEVPPLNFFSEEEALTLQAILDRVLPQSDREKEYRVPILNMIDDRLHSKRFDGYIFEGMPEEDESHRLGLRAVSGMSLALHKKAFSDLNPTEQESILISIREDKPLVDLPIWKKMPCGHYWSLLIQDAVSAYYSHPLAWDEIGFGGPAYPRGYMRLTGGLPEPWEVKEQRYEWKAPDYTKSDEFKENEDIFSKSSRHGDVGSH